MFDFFLFEAVECLPMVAEAVPAKELLSTISENACGTLSGPTLTREIPSTRRNDSGISVFAETVAPLVCCTDVELFGEVGEVLSEAGDKERTNYPLIIISNPSFTMRWTCLSLVATQKP